MTVFNFLNSCEELLLLSLCLFYSDPKKFDTFYYWRVQSEEISLRLLDFFATNYAYNNSIWHNDINVYWDYKGELKGYTKRLFDPFCRSKNIHLYVHEKINKDNNKYYYFTIKQCKSSNGVNVKSKSGYETCCGTIHNIKDYKYEIRTTVGQLHFFKWCINRDIFKYILQNYDEILNAMRDNSLKHYKDKQQQRQLKSKTIKSRYQKLSPPSNKKNNSLLLSKENRQITISF